MATETTLWDMSDKRPEKIIYAPEGIENEQIVSSLMHGYDLSKLQEAAYEVRENFKKYKLVALDKDGKKYEPAPITLMLSNKKKLKKDYAAYLAIMKHTNNFSLYYEEWSKPVKELFKQTAANHYILHTDATMILGEPSIKESRYFWDDPEINQKLDNWYGTIEAKAPITNKNTYEHSNYYLELADNSYYVLTLPSLFPELMNIEKCEELPDAEAYKTYSGENTIFTVVPIMSSLFDSGQLNLGRNKLPASELKKTSKLLKLPEFFTDDNKYFSNICASFVLNFYTIYRMDLYNNDMTETQDLLKDLFKNLNEMQEYLMPILLPHITGLRKNLFNYCSCGYLINILQSVLKKFHKEEWLPIDKLLFHCRVSPQKTESQFLLFYCSDLFKANFCNDYDGKEIYCDDIIQELTYPYLKAALFMMAAFGFVEIAYKEKPDEGATSYYDTLAYVRLTNLGLYALDIKRKYVRTKEAEIHYFELDTEHLIIKSLVDNNPYESLLSNMSTAISKKMYKVSYESFLNGCEKLQDINSKIDFFKEYISSQDLPDNWVQFFKDIKKRCKPMKAPKKKYSLLQIPTDDKELQHIILTDPTIRKYTLKAEGFILLVETNYKSKVVEALKKYGYLI